MKKFLIVSVLVLISSSSLANVSDEVCYVTGTNIAYDLSTSTPRSEGSRLFYQIGLSKSKNPDNPDLVIQADSKQYIIHYADGVLEDGAPYSMLRIQDRNKPDAELYVYQRGISKTRNNTVSEFSSTLDEFKVSIPKNATIYCEGD
jgi:predicted small secreted protein